MNELTLEQKLTKVRANGRALIVQNNTYVDRVTDLYVKQWIENFDAQFEINKGIETAANAYVKNADYSYTDLFYAFTERLENPDFDVETLYFILQTWITAGKHDNKFAFNMLSDKEYLSVLESLSARMFDLKFDLRNLEKITVIWLYIGRLHKSNTRVLLTDFEKNHVGNKIIKGCNRLVREYYYCEDRV